MSLLVVTEAFADFSTGHPEIYNPGRLVDSDDPVVRSRAGYFEPADVAASRQAGTETATAAPGEQRTRTAPRKRAAKPRKKAAAKKAAAPQSASSPSSEQV